MAWAVDAGRRAALVIVLALAATALAVVQAPTAAAYPGADEIEAAKEAIQDQAASIDELDAAIAALEQAAEDAEVAQLVAAEDYHEAQDANIDAQRALFSANARADEAADALDQARAGLAAVAQATYRNGGDLDALEAILKADGFEDVIARYDALGRASSSADLQLQQVRAAALVAETMQAYADAAAEDALGAERAARAALDDAKQAQADALSAVEEARAVQEMAISQLAALRGVAIELEQERQEGLAAARDAAAAERAAAERERAESGGSSGGSAGGSSGGSSGGSTGGSSGGSSGGSTGGSSGGSTGGSSGGSTGGSSGGSTGGSNGGSGGSTPDPEPTEDDTTPLPGGATSGWKSSAAAGVAAADYSLTLQGLPYLLGGSGPDSYDCSGLTQASWRAAGYSIPRTSRTQYAGLTRVSFSNLRVGDLLFWGDDQIASEIYHVAIYIGNGKVMEARKPGVPASTRYYDDWGIENLMPYVARP